MPHSRKHECLFAERSKEHVHYVTGHGWLLVLHLKGLKTQSISIRYCPFCGKKLNGNGFRSQIP